MIKICIGDIAGGKRLTNDDTCLFFLYFFFQPYEFVEIWLAAGTVSVCLCVYSVCIPFRDLFFCQ